MNRRSLPLVLLFLIPLLAGCTSGYEGKPHNGLMGLNFYSEYDGSLQNDDYDVYAELRVPTGETGVIRVGDSGSREVEDGGASAKCERYKSAWIDKEWWFEITLYTERDLTTEVSHIRVNDSDCIQYAIEIAPNGDMTVHEGYPPWHPELDLRIEDWLKNTLLVIGLVVVFGGLGVGGWMLMRKERE